MTVFIFPSNSRRNKPLTRRGILSVLSSIYDTLGFLAPIILSDKLLLHYQCRQKLNWDNQISEDDEVFRKRWLNDLQHIQKIKIPRMDASLLSPCGLSR